MATSRTGTTKWLHLARRARHQAQAAGQAHCPICGTLLNYAVGRTPSSAEVDHIIPYSRGGTDTIDNVRIICRRCNQQRGNGLTRPRPASRQRNKHQATMVAATAHTDTW